MANIKILTLTAKEGSIWSPLTIRQFEFVLDDFVQAAHTSISSDVFVINGQNAYNLHAAAVVNLLQNGDFEKIA
jgi:hypothetical protein